MDWIFLLYPGLAAVTFERKTMQRFTRKSTWLCTLISCTMLLPAMVSAAEPNGGNAYADVNDQAQASTPQNRHAASSINAERLAPHQYTATQRWTAVGTDLLEKMRGGFSVDSGLKVSFGIERTISINGDLVSNTSFNLQDLSKLVNGQADISALDAGTVKLVQNGSGNHFELGQISQGTAATFIQNNLNDQTIQSMTVINATSSSLDLLKSMNTQSALRDAIVNSVSIR
jgi:hypothetical protein